MSSVSITETENLYHLQDEEKEEEEEEAAARAAYSYQYKSSGSSSCVWEIEEESENSGEVNHKRLWSIQEESTEIISSSSISSSSLFSFDVRINNINNKGDHDHEHEEEEEEEKEDCVYVGISDKDEYSSLDALSWTLNHLPTTMVCLVHVFPEIRHIPSPLGKLPKSQVSPEQVENYMAQERRKRRDFLQKFLSMCTTSKVKVDTVLIESDMVAKAFLDLMPILHMRKLVLGTTKSGLRRSKTKKGSGLIDQILENAPEYCEIKVIYEGKEVKDQIINGSPSPRGAADHVGENTKSIPVQDQVQPANNDSFACMCFKPPRVM